MLLPHIITLLGNIAVFKSRHLTTISIALKQQLVRAVLRNGVRRQVRICVHQRVLELHCAAYIGVTSLDYLLEGGILILVKHCSGRHA